MRRDISSGLPPRRIRRLRNSAVTMRRPTSGAIDRATVSTSGSSGTFGHLEEDVVALHAHLERGDALRRVVIEFPGPAIEFPHVIRADHAAVVQRALSQWAAAMGADTAQRVDFTR